MPEWIYPIATIIFSAGAAYGGVVTGQNGTKTSLKNIEKKIDTIDDKVTNNTANIAENKNQIQNQRSICEERSKAVDDIKKKVNKL